MSIEIIKRGKGNILLFQGHEYTKHSHYKSGNVMWRCNQRHKTKCKGSITVTPVSLYYIIFLFTFYKFFAKFLF